MALLAVVSGTVPGAWAAGPGQPRFDRIHAAEPPADQPCLDAIQAAERTTRLPPKLLGAIGIVESGRLNPLTRRVDPWPWTINVEGAGFFFESKAAAIAAVQAAQAKGVQSIDVGCMQINLMHHPTAFLSLDEAFDPQANAAYAAGFLMRLFGQFQNWAAAAGAYHSQTPALSDDYQQRVAASWPNAARFGLPSRSPARAAAQASLDPFGVYTPEFRAILAQNAADRAARVAIGVAPAQQRSATLLSGGSFRRAQARSTRFLHASLAD